VPGVEGHRTVLRLDDQQAAGILGLDDEVEQD
jgi:hypothetical protein